ncbi:MAG: L,D-transpeptidase family protein [Nitrospiraceae bacterium]|nr:MAG: L,D-transpeptidase family protein [Nitrospiraceae bacterium]
MQIKKIVRHFIPAFLLILIPLLLPVDSADNLMLAKGIQADYVLVKKSSRELMLYSGADVIKTYRIALGKNPEGHKVREGDKRTPEGMYFIDSRKEDSKYHLALHISYPDAIDVLKARRLGSVPGGGIMIHGTGDEYAWMGKLHTAINWTDGCIAVTNEEIEEIWQLVPDGTLIEIKP